VGLDVNTSKRYKTIAISQLTPYWTEDGVSRRYEIFYRTLRPPLVDDDHDYRVNTLGGSVKFGVPFTELDRVFFGIGVEANKVETYSDSPWRYKQFVADNGGPKANANPYHGGNATALGIPLTVAWQRDSRDSALVPTDGRLQRANLELSLLGDMRYYRATYQHQYYFPLFLDGTLMLNGEMDYGHGFGDKTYPVFKNFYAGGIGSVRGFESSSLGRKEESYYGREYVGGAKRVIGNIELQFPIPGADRTLRWFTFVDAGNVFAEEETIKVGELRYSTGFGVSWVSPMGPLRLSMGYPLNAKSGDQREVFQFTLGTGF
jgi:outer membrane protein insertion porin family